MKKSTIWKLIFASSLALSACSDWNKQSNGDQVDEEGGIEYVVDEVNDQLGTVIRYPEKYKDWDRFDEQWHNISEKMRNHGLEIDTLQTDSLEADSLINSTDTVPDSLERHEWTEDSLKIDSLFGPTDDEKQLHPFEVFSIDKKIQKVQHLTGREVFITIDDWPSEYTSEIAQELHRRGHEVTFFVVGNNVKEKYYPAMQKAVELWHEYGNHSTTHPNFRKISLYSAKSELETTKEKIEEAGISPAPYFRFPYWNEFKDQEAFDKYLKEIWYEKVFRTIDTRDRNKKTTKNELIRSLKDVKPWSVILIHERPYTVEKIIPPLDSVLKSKWLHSVPYRPIKK